MPGSKDGSKPVKSQLSAARSPSFHYTPSALNRRLPSISAVFPAYNDAGTIASMVLAALTTCASLTDDYEVIVVENGSTDYTVEVLEDLAKTHERLRISTHREALGYGGALRLGFKLATKDFIFYTDGDAQYDAHELALLVTALRPEVDVVQGYKIARHDPIFRIVIGRVYHWIVKLAFGLPIRDTDCDFRLIRKSALARFTLRSTTGTFPVELVKKLHDSGAVFSEVPVHHYHRAYGRSQFFNFPRLWATGMALLKLWRDLSLMPRITGRKAVKSIKPPMQIDDSNPSLVYSTDVQDRALSDVGRQTTDDRRQATDGQQPPIYERRQGTGDRRRATGDRRRSPESSPDNTSASSVPQPSSQEGLL